MPKMKAREDRVEEMVSPKNDSTGNLIVRVAQYAVLLMFGFVSIFFTPGLLASLGFDKVLLTMVLGAVVLIAVSLLMLRRSRAKTVMPFPLMLFWGVVGAGLISGLLSGDVQDTMRGSTIEVHTVAFLALMALVMSLTLVMQGSKIMTIRALTFFAGTSSLLLVYILFRILFGADFFAFGSFGAVTASPIGGFNDVALFSGLILILGLITLVQLPLRAGFQYAIGALCLLALVLLAIVNFFNVWIVIGFFGLLMFIYLLSRDTLFRSDDAPDPEPQSKVLVAVTMMVCVLSAMFIVAGDYAGEKVSEWTDVNYIEVRPSIGATADVAAGVYQENVLLGVGPNRFADAWRQYKNRSINETIFWDTDFNAGSGYVPTLFVNLGILGGILVVAFHLAFLYLGFRMLLRSGLADSYWYYFGVASFAATVYIWGMSYIYVPGVALLLLGAIFTGFSFVAAGALLPSTVRTIPLAVNRRRGFFLMAAVILIITASIGALFSVGEQYIAQARFTEAQISAESIPAFEQAALASFNLYPDDRFISTRAQIQLANLNALLNVAEPSEEQQQQFLTTAEQGLIFADQAVSIDYTNPDHHAVLAGIYSNLASAGIDGAQERAEASLAEAQRLDPLNPGYRLLAAQMAARIGDVEMARNEIGEALNLKRNYTEALYLSAQLDISEGNTESAISTTRSMITLEPNNATRYFQLGMLLSADEQFNEAVAAYQAAITIDPQYANARYMLALAHLRLDETEPALTQLRRVQETNAENESLNQLIQQIESGESFSAPDLGLETPVNDAAPTIETDEQVITDTDIDTDLITPVNAGGGSDAEEQPILDSVPENTAESETGTSTAE